MAYLIDTNILVRLANRNDAYNAAAARAVLELHRRGEVLNLTAQALRRLAKITYPSCYYPSLRSWILGISLFVERPGAFAGRFGLEDMSGKV